MPVSRSARASRDASGAARLLRLRETLGLSQREIAEELGVAHGAVGLWETGARALPGPVLKLLALYEAELGLGDRPTEEGLRKLRSTWPSRTLTLSRTAGAVAARALAGAVQRLFVDENRSHLIAQKTQLAIARRIVQTLSEMKGLAMKIGLMAGYLDFDLSDQTRDTLAELQSRTRPMVPSTVARVFLQELGQGPGKLFREWSSEPLAAASIGQVHRARLPGGQEVAVKVQYPDIEQAVAADLENAALVDRAAGLILRGQKPGVLLQQVRQLVLEECDYRREAAQQEELRRLWAGCPGVRIPRVFPELTTRRILVTELAHARTFQQFVATASQADRDQAGQIIHRFAYESIFRHGLFNCDPHPGNFLFADGEVVFLDFGCVKRLGPEQLRRWRGFVRAILSSDAPAMERLAVEAGIVPDPARFDFEDHRRTLQLCYAPELTDGPFRFTPKHIQKIWQSISRSQNRFSMNLPPDWMLINKVQCGVGAILAQLRASGDWRRTLWPLVHDQAPVRPDLHREDPRAPIGTEA
jgi:predicted unusual protein kinase regulating ubiquinone biosynthesis (AarF/ABC1/UbiB family)/DNA-binding XRE family transcriptional regulator